MAGLTKEERAKRELEKKTELEEKIKKELEEKLRAEYDEKLKANSSTATIAKGIQKVVRLPLDMVVPVTSIMNGKLSYSSKKITGYVIEWDSYGSTEYMELSELVSMRNTDRRFFEDNWIICEDTEDYTSSEIYDFLKVTKFYKYIYTPDEIDDFFKLSTIDAIKAVSLLSRGMKDCIATKAQELITSGKLDSNNMIDALSESLKVEFTR